MLEGSSPYASPSGSAFSFHFLANGPPQRQHCFRRSVLFPLFRSLFSPQPPLRPPLSRFRDCPCCGFLQSVVSATASVSHRLSLVCDPPPLLLLHDFACVSLFFASVFPGALLDLDFPFNTFFLECMRFLRRPDFCHSPFSLLFISPFSSPFYLHFCSFLTLEFDPDLRSGRSGPACKDHDSRSLLPSAPAFPPF